MGFGEFILNIFIFIWDKFSLNYSHVTTFVDVMLSFIKKHCRNYYWLKDRLDNSTTNGGKHDRTHRDN